MKRQSRLLAVALLFLTALAGLACRSTPAHTFRVARVTAFAQPEAGFSPEQLAAIEDNCPLGLPEKDPAFEHGPTAYVVREGYVLEHSPRDKIALWVCEHVAPDELVGDADRRDRFRADPELSPGERAELSDYRRSGFDRGHQAPAGNQAASQSLKDETFFLSNMAPQVGRGFNRDAWRILEEITREWVADGVVPDAYMITGGLFYDPAEDDPETADGLIEYAIIGEGAVAAPTHFYKIVVARDGEAWKAVAFVLENQRQPTPEDFSAFIRPIDWIEEHTGLDFMPDLDPLSEQTVEGSPGEVWGGAP